LPAMWGFMGKFDVIKRNGPLLYPNMAQRGTGHAGSKFLRFVTFIDDSKTCSVLLFAALRSWKAYSTL